MSEVAESEEQAPVKRFNFELASKVALGVSGLIAIAVLALGFSEVHCVKNCGSIIKFQYYQYRHLFLTFIAIQCFGWFCTFNIPIRAVKWTFFLSVFLIIHSAWVYGAVFQWNALATFYFGNIAPLMNKFILL